MMRIEGYNFFYDSQSDIGRDIFYIKSIMANVRIKRLLLAITMLVAIFAYYRFLDFYQMNGQEYYIFVEWMRGE